MKRTAHPAMQVTQQTSLLVRKFTMITQFRQTHVKLLFLDEPMGETEFTEAEAQHQHA